MAKIYSTPYSMSKEGETKALSIGVLSSSDLAPVSETAEKVVEKNVNSPLDRPETWTFACTEVADAYKNSGISPQCKPASVRGVQIMVKHESITQVTDDTTGAENYLKQIPYSVHLVVRTPINELVTSDAVLAEVQRTMAGLFGDGTDVTSGRLKELLNSALKAA